MAEAGAPTGGVNILTGQQQHFRAEPKSTAIAETCKKCFRSFHDLGNILQRVYGEVQSTLSQPQQKKFSSPETPPAEDLDELLDRFKLWAANCGAHRVGRMSLDHRLRDAMRVHRQVVNLLEELEEALGEGISSAKNLSSAPARPTDYTGTSGNNDPLVRFRSDLEYAILDVRHVIKCLYRFSTVLHQPVPIDRLRKCASIPIDTITDITHAADKFPSAERFLTNRLGRANTKRRQLLQYHERHHQKIAGLAPPDQQPQELEYDEETQAQLDEEMRPKFDSNAVKDGAYGENRHTAEDTEDMPTEVSNNDLGTTLSSTEASHYVHPIATDTNWISGILPEDHQSDAGQSNTSFASSISEEFRYRVPEPPEYVYQRGSVYGGEPFECPYCHDMISVSSSNAWKHHVFSDLMPYVCTFEDCANPDHMYGSRHEWFKHETQAHRREWYCEACNEIYLEKDLIVKHLADRHQGEFDKPQSHYRPIIDFYERARTSKQHCPLCPVNVPPTRDHLERSHKIVDDKDVLYDKEANVRDFAAEEERLFKTDPFSCPYCPVTYEMTQLRRHLGRHLQQLALFTLPRTSADDDYDDEGSNSARRDDDSLSQFGTIGSIPDAEHSGEEDGMQSQIGDTTPQIQPTLESNQATDESLKTTGHIKLDDRAYELLEMLSPLRPHKRHQDIKSIQAENTGLWLLQHQSFIHWISEGNPGPQTDRVLCCYGIPGAGKTVMSSIVIDDLTSRFFNPKLPKVGIAFLYSDYRDQGAQTLSNILGSFLQQFLSMSLLPIPEEVRQVLESCREKNRQPGKDNLLALLQTTLDHLELAFICIDALDELEQRTRGELLQTINELGAHSNSMRVFLTARKHIQSQLRGISTNSIEIVAHPDDIRSYLKRKITNDINTDAMDQALEDEIVTTLVEQSEKMFLLPTLHIDMVLQRPTKFSRRKALEMVPSELYDWFGSVIERINYAHRGSGAREIAMQVLMWLHLAYRPLQLTEIQHALSVVAGQTDLDPDNIPSEKIILDSCLGLVTVDKATRTIHFVHYTLEEYFRRSSDSYFPGGCSTSAEICLTYLNFRDLVPHCPTLKELRQRVARYAFLKYAAVNWGYYVARGCNDTIKNLAIKTLEQSGKTPCPLQVLYSLLPKVNWYYSLESGPTDVAQGIVAIEFSGVHAAAHFGLLEVLEYLCSTIAPDLKDDNGHTPLSLAAKEGHEPIVRLLLERDDVDVNSKDMTWGRTPLSYAAEEGHEAVVRLLLERDDVDVDSKDTSDRTPLAYAAKRGYEAVVRLLLERDDVDVDSKDMTWGRTPLFYAAEEGHEAVVRLLLERDDVDVNSKDTSDRTPLSYAAEGHEAVVRLLLERNDVDVDSKGTNDRTPLSYAAEKGHEAVVRLLLERDDVDVNSKDMTWGRTPLAYAAKKGHEAVVRLLLERDDVDVNSKDITWDRTPLSYAAEEGHEAVVRLLLTRNDVDLDARTSTGYTAADLARRNQHDAIADLLSSERISRGSLTQPAVFPKEQLPN